jgi:hypothetical protein
MHKFESGKFTYTSTIVQGDHVRPVEFEITLDLNHPEIRRLIWRAYGNKTKQAIEASGALKIQAS